MPAMVAGLGQILGPWLFHHTLREVVLAILVRDAWLLRQGRAPIAAGAT